ncbi:MAG TPA: hypothetical protein VLL97_05510, partial [Acidobacteriota bacterium]|nr:hypothetical protein [Acidobacteriota bacterium]
MTLRTEIENMREQLNRNLHAAELQLAHIRARLHFPEIQVPSRLSLAFRDLNFRMTKRLAYSRGDLKNFWGRTGKLKLIFAHPRKAFLNLLKDIQLFLIFMRDLARV